MRKEETRIRILDSALDLFWRSSYHAVNMNAVSCAAGLNKATVYQYFGSKEEMAVAAIHRGAERTRAYAYEGAFEAKQDPHDRLSEIYQRIYATQKSIFRQDGKCRGCPFVNIGVELATSSVEVRNAVNAAFRSFEPFYREIVHDLKSNGILNDRIDEEKAVAALIANMNASLVGARLENRPEAILEGAERAFDIIRA